MFAALAAFLAMNVVAFLHARAFTHYGPPGKRMDDPEDLSWKELARVALTGVRVPRPVIKRNPVFWTWYEEHAFESTRGVRLAAWRLPRRDAPAVVLMFHGYGGSKSGMLDEAYAFRSLGYDVFMVDFRGSGESSGSVTTLGWREADDVVASVRFVREQAPDKPLILYGSSMGAAAVLRAMAVKGVRPDAAVLECPFDSLLSTVGNRFHMMGLPAFPFAHLLVFWGGAQFGFNGFSLRPCDYAAKSPCPVLLINGGRDRRVTVDQARRIFDNLNEPKRFELFEDAGHGEFVENDGRRWRRAVSEFLKPVVAPEKKAEAARRIEGG